MDKDIHGCHCKHGHHHDEHSKKHHCEGNHHKHDHCHKGHGHFSLHHHHEHKISSLNTVFIISIVLNLLFVIIESGMGFWSNSLGLLSDAGHNLSDVFSLLLALIAFKLSTSNSNNRFTYGYRKSSILISLLNAIILLIAVGAILVESIEKLTQINDLSVNAEVISWTAGIGIIVNGLTAWLLMRQELQDINVKGAFLHMLADTLVSVGVVLSGVIIKFTGWSIIDPIIGILIALLILISTWKLLKESLRMSIDAVPENIDFEKISKLISTHQGVQDVHHMHIWPLSTHSNALTAHIVVQNLNEIEKIKLSLKDSLKQEGIDHITLEFESLLSQCSEKDCSCD